MPKKRLQQYKQLQGPSSLNSARAVTNNGSSSSAPPASVNERLTELRNLPSEESDRKKRELADTVNQRSVPPELRSILGVPETAPPRPKTGIRFRDRMRTPGPPPPKSWLGLNGDWHFNLALRKGKPKKSGGDVEPRIRPDRLQRFRDMTGFENHTPSRRGAPSLVHVVLKRLAEEWESLDEEDYPALIQIPLPLRLEFLSYLGFYGAPIDSLAFDSLTQGTHSVDCLDLAALVGYGRLTVKRLAKILDPAEQQRVLGNDSSDVADSWDADDSFEAALRVQPTIQRFENLTHLCLSHPPPTASWRDLLGLSKVTPQITHLSLAYWPRPTLTPNLATTTVTSRHSPVVSAGGSNYYSGIENDLIEPASILRQLSSRLLRVQWLDLEGCAEWMPALGSDDRGFLQPDAALDYCWSSNFPPVLTIFGTNWTNLSYINCAQGWLPPLSGIHLMNVSQSTPQWVQDDLPPYLGKRDNDITSGKDYSATYYDSTKRKANMWVETEKRLLAAGQRINQVRRPRGRPVMMDFNWRQIAP